LGYSRQTTQTDREGNSHETNNCRDFHDSKGEFCFAIASDAKQVDKQDDNEEDGDEDRFRKCWVPVPDGQGASDDLDGQDGNPLQCIAANYKISLDHGETCAWY
jgi:hypothetical protein